MAKRDAASRTLDTKRRAAALFVNGPERVRGNWEAVCNLLGKRLDPHDEDQRRLIEEEGGTVPAVEVVLDTPASSNGRTGGFEPPSAGSIPEAGILRRIKNDDEWCRLARELDATVKGIADGTVRATAAQAATIRHILDRCYGKVQEKASEKKPAAGLIVLPVLGSGMHAQTCFTTCPQCGWTTDAPKREGDGDGQPS